MTVGEAATSIYGEMVFDTALPQFWVNWMRDNMDYDVRGHFVWGYPAEHSTMGAATPITAEGYRLVTERNDELEVPIHLPPKTVRNEWHIDQGRKER